MVRKEHEESEALGELKFPSDVSEHMVPCWPREVCTLHSHSLPLHPSFSLSPSPSLGAIFVHYLRNLLPFISLFWETWSQPANHPFSISNGAIFLVLRFWSSFWKVKEG